MMEGLSVPGSAEIIGPHMAMLLANTNPCWGTAGSVFTPKPNNGDDSDIVAATDACFCGNEDLFCCCRGSSFVAMERGMKVPVGYVSPGLSSCRFLHSNFPR